MLHILELFIAYLLLPGLVIGVVALFVSMLVSVLRAKKRNQEVSKGKKIALIVSAAILLTLVIAFVSLVIVFALAISFM